MRKRRGYTLVEVVLVMGALIAVIGLCVTMMHGLLKLDRAGRARLNEAGTLNRLAWQFRQDVHAASRCRPTAGENSSPTTLELSLPSDRVVSFKWDASRVLRTENAPGAVERHESYRLPAHTAPRFQVSETQDRVWVSMLVGRKPALGGDVPAREFQVEALLGKDRRFTRPEEASR